MGDDLGRFLIARFGEDGAELRRHAEAGNPSELWGRLVADCDAKRRVVLQHGRVAVGRVRQRAVVCMACGPDAGWPCLTLRLLALPYVDHPDYRQSWAL